MLLLLYLVVKTEQYIVTSSCRFLDEKTMLEIWLNPWLNLTIFRGTGPDLWSSLLSTRKVTYSSRGEKRWKYMCVRRVLSTRSVLGSGADPGFFLGGGALDSCSISTPINHSFFFFAEYQLY